MAGFQFPFKIGPRDLFRGNDFFDGENINADTLSVWVRENKFSFDVIQQLLGKLYPFKEELLTSPNYERRFFTNLAATIGDVSAFSGLSKDHSNVFITVDLVEGKTDQILLLPIDTSSTPTGSASVSGAVKTSEQQLTANGNWYALNGSKVLKLFKAPGAGESVTYKVNIPAYKYTQEATVIPSMAQLEDNGNKCSVTYRGLEGNYAKYEIQFPAISNLITGVGTDGELTFGAVTFSGTAPVYMLPAKFRGVSLANKPYLEGSNKAGLELPFGSVFCWNIVTGLPVYTNASSASFGSEEVKFFTCSDDFGTNPADDIDPTKLIMLIPNQQQLTDSNGDLIEENATDSETYAFVFEAETLSEKIAKIIALLEYFNSSITGIDTASLTNRFVAGANPTKTQNPVTPKPSKIEGNFFPQYLLRQGYQLNSDPANLDNAMLGDLVLPYYQSSDVNVLLANPSTNPLTRALKFGTSGELKGKTYSSAQYGDADFITASKGIELTNNLLKFGASPNAGITWNGTDSDLRVLIGNYIGASFKAGYLALPSTNTTSWNTSGYTKGIILDVNSDNKVTITDSGNDNEFKLILKDVVGGKEATLSLTAGDTPGINSITQILFDKNIPSFLKFSAFSPLFYLSHSLEISGTLNTNANSLDSEDPSIFSGGPIQVNGEDSASIFLAAGDNSNSSVPNFNDANKELAGDWWINCERVAVLSPPFNKNIKRYVDDINDETIENYIKNKEITGGTLSSPVVMHQGIVRKLIIYLNNTLSTGNIAMFHSMNPADPTYTDAILCEYDGADWQPVNIATWTNFNNAFSPGDRSNIVSIVHSYYTSPYGLTQSSFCEFTDALGTPAITLRNSFLPSALTAYGGLLIIEYTDYS